VDEEKKELVVPSVGVIEIFKFSTPLDTALICIGILLAVLGGAALPVMTIIFGDTLQAFVDYATFTECTGNGVVDETYSPLPVLERFAWQMCGIGLGIWLDAYIFISCFNTAASRQVFKIRTEFLRAVLRQDISWYDQNTTTDFASRMTDDLNKLQEGIGEKIGMCFFFLGTFFISLVIAFIYGWELTLVLLCMIPLMSIANGSLAKVQTTLAEREMSAYAKAGAIAEEVLSGIRTVVAFGGQDKEINRYVDNLSGAKKSGILRGALTGASGGVTFGIMFAVYGLGFWYGVKLIMDDRESEACVACFANETDPDLIYACLNDCVRYNAKSLLTVFFSILIGGFQIGQAAPYVESFNIARSAAGAVYRVIERDSEIDSSSTTGDSPKSITGNISFRNIYFNYPSRPDVKILRGLTLDVPAGKTVALVGSSGCGKSTCIQLVQRFYDPLEGSVLLDNKELRTLNVGWLRDNIGVVGQEPVLFDCTIKENILYGRPSASDNDIVNACKNANAFDFIMNLPRQFDTMVGERGTQLSGGQKQRIAIARALVRNPQILLLDEATSALDNESESIVQAALDRARSGRTTIVVAHRLSTIKSADLIVAMNQGVVEEMGTHEELMKLEGLYHSLVTRQMAGHDPNKKKESIQRLTSSKENETTQMDIMDSNKRYRVASEGEEEMEKAPKIEYARLFKINSPEWLYITIGVLSSCAMGGSMPVFSVLFGDVTAILGYEDTQKARDESVFYAIMFGLLGIGSMLAQFLQGFMFGISGENLTLRLRRDAFSAMLRQEMGWYDAKENSTGALCARLSGDAAKVQGATGARVGSILQGIAGMLIAIVLGLCYNWKLGLVCAVFFPLLIGAVMLEMRITMGVDSVEKKAFEDSAKLAIEAITNIRTVAGLRCEDNYVTRYTNLLAVPHKQSLVRAHKRGALFGFSQAAQFFGWGITTYYGGYLVVTECMDYQNVYIVTNAIIGGAGMIGYSFAFTADFNKALVAASRIFSLLDRRPEIDANPATGLQVNVSGNIDVTNAGFSYPTRPEIQVLNGLDLVVEQGSKVALVGSSGCGKSTVIQLIQRFYDLKQGSLCIDGKDIQQLNLPLVRSALGIVSQEPTLFDRTIAENIQYGDNGRQVSLEEVIGAARQANIHSFIAALPEGYETRVGSKGTQLSGGQKQRIAIARALVRNPKVLLLDEATSALDTESEKVVQDALDEAQKGRTSITIAHRLSTIKDSDRIFVFDKGCIVESGSHEDLLKYGGLYHRLWNASS